MPSLKGKNVTSKPDSEIPPEALEQAERHMRELLKLYGDFQHALLRIMGSTRCNPHELAAVVLAAREVVLEDLEGMPELGGARAVENVQAMAHGLLLNLGKRSPYEAAALARFQEIVATSNAVDQSGSSNDASN